MSLLTVMPRKSASTRLVALASDALSALMFSSLTVFSMFFALSLTYLVSKSATSGRWSILIPGPIVVETVTDFM